MLILIYGGSGSGKSAFAEEIFVKKADLLGCTGRYYLATMQVYGEEGRQKVERHRRLREGKGFQTLEYPREICRAAAELKPEGSNAILLECLSNLTANEMFGGDGIRGEAETVETIADDIRELMAKTDCMVIVTNNVFEDGISYAPETAAYQRVLGLLNRRIAELADIVYEVVVGIPILWKGEASDAEENR